MPDVGSLLIEGHSLSLALVAGFAKYRGVSVIARPIHGRGTNGQPHNTATIIDANGRHLVLVGLRIDGQQVNMA